MSAHEQQPAPPRELFPYVQRETYRERNTPSKEQQAQRLEVLRYRTYLAQSLRQRIMQRLGDFGREILPWLVRDR